MLIERIQVSVFIGKTRWWILYNLSSGEMEFFFSGERRREKENLEKKEKLDQKLNKKDNDP